METLKFTTQELPLLEASGFRYVIVAHSGSWRDGEAASYLHEIPRLKRELTKRFFNRFNLGNTQAG